MEGWRDEQRGIFESEIVTYDETAEIKTERFTRFARRLTHDNSNNNKRF